MPLIDPLVSHYGLICLSCFVLSCSSGLLNRVTFWLCQVDGVAGLDARMQRASAAALADAAAALEKEVCSFNRKQDNSV